VPSGEKTTAITSSLWLLGVQNSEQCSTLRRIARVRSHPCRACYFQQEDPSQTRATLSRCRKDLRWRVGVDTDRARTSAWAG